MLYLFAFTLFIKSTILDIEMNYYVAINFLTAILIPIMAWIFLGIINRSFAPMKMKIPEYRLGYERLCKATKTGVVIILMHIAFQIICALIYQGGFSKANFIELLGFVIMLICIGMINRMESFVSFTGQLNDIIPDSDGIEIR